MAISVIDLHESNALSLIISRDDGNCTVVRFIQSSNALSFISFIPSCSSTDFNEPQFKKVYSVTLPPKIDAVSNAAQSSKHFFPTSAPSGITMFFKEEHSLNAVSYIFTPSDNLMFVRLEQFLNAFLSMITPSGISISFKLSQREKE